MTKLSEIAGVLPEKDKGTDNESWEQGYRMGFNKLHDQLSQVELEGKLDREEVRNIILDKMLDENIGFQFTGDGHNLDLLEIITTAIISTCKIKIVCVEKKK